MIHPEAGTLRAGYADGRHLVHRASARVVPGRSVAPAAAPGAPAFRLAYAPTGPDTVAVAFPAPPPGGGPGRPIATGAMRRDV